MEDNRIKSLNQLKELAGKQQLECYIILAKGTVRSSKSVQYNPDYGCWDIFHNIDDNWEEFKSDEEFKEKYPLFFEAMEKGCLIKY